MNFDLLHTKSKKIIQIYNYTRMVLFRFHLVFLHMLAFCFLFTSLLPALSFYFSSLILCNRSFSVNRPEFGFLLGWTTFCFEHYF